MLYVSVIVSGACIYASTPLMYELGSELAYPVQEGIVGLTLSFVNTGVAIIFLLLLEIPSLGKSIMFLEKWEKCQKIHLNSEVNVWKKSSFSQRIQICSMIFLFSLAHSVLSVV